MVFSIFGGRAAARPLLLFGLEALALLGPGVFAAADPVPAPRATVAPRQFDFGLVRSGEKVVHAFSVHNSGNARLAFTGAELSMPGMTCRISPPLDPGADGTITIEWKTDHVQGTVEGVAEISTNDPAAPSIALTLSGHVEGILDIEPLPAIFLSTFRGEGVQRTLSLRAHVGRPVGLRLVPSAGAHYRATIDPASGAAAAWRLAVEAAPDAPSGRYDESLRIESDDAAIGAVTIPVHVFVKPDLYANPGDLDFGANPVARLRDPAARKLIAQTFFVKKRAGTFRITRIRSDVSGLDLRVDPPSGAAGSFQIDAGIRGDAVMPCSLDGTITIETDDPRFPRLTVEVRGRVVD
jgi:hypothetical protein